MIHDLSVTYSQLIGWVDQNRTLILFFSCTVLGAAGAWLIAGMPFRKHLLDTPNERSSHLSPTPRGGGLGILVAFIVAGLTLRLPTTFLFAAILIAAVSFYGDYLHISVKFRLIVQFVAVLIFLFPLLSRLNAQLAASTFVYSPVIFFLMLPLIVLFLIGTTNFYNFMDGINGIAGLSGLVAFGLLGIYTLYLPHQDVLQTALSFLSICVALACLGFLPFNMPRARVFMGDVGSILLGFVFAALVVMLARNILEMVCFAAFLFPFYADELTTMAIRLHDHESLFQPHRRHLYQILANEAGVAHWKVTLMYGAAQIAVTAGVVTANAFSVWPAFLFLAACFIAFTLLSLFIRKRYKNQSAMI